MMVSCIVLLFLFGYIIVVIINFLFLHTVVVIKLLFLCKPILIYFLSFLLLIFIQILTYLINFPTLILRLYAALLFKHFIPFLFLLFSLFIIIPHNKTFIIHFIFIHTCFDSSTFLQLILLLLRFLILIWFGFYDFFCYVFKHGTVILPLWSLLMNPLVWIDRLFIWVFEITFVEF